MCFQRLQLTKEMANEEDVEDGPVCRTYNDEVLLAFERIDITVATAGMHIHNAPAITHSIIEEKCGDVLHLIGPVTTNGKTDFTRYTHQIDIREKVNRAIYSENVKAVNASTVANAFRLMMSPASSDFKQNPIEFAMYCTTGRRKWNYAKVQTSDLKPGEHIIYGLSGVRNHAIVESTQPEMGQIKCIYFDDLEIKRKDGIKPIKLERAVYNARLDYATALRTAQTQADRTNEHLTTDNENNKKCHFWNKSAKTFAVWCSTGEKEISTTVDPVYPPAKRQHSTDLLIKYREIPVTDITKGDHIRNFKKGIYDSIVTEVNQNYSPGEVQVTLCGYQQKEIKEHTDHSIPDKIEEYLLETYERVFFKKRDVVDVAVYASCLAADHTVKKAQAHFSWSIDKPLGSKFVKNISDYRRNYMDFAMECKIGASVTWAEAPMETLEPGDSVSWKHWRISPTRNYGIVESVDGPCMTCISYIYHHFKPSEIERIKAESPTVLQKATYISGFAPETSLALAQSRLGEQEYRPVHHDDKALAKWCKTGQSGWGVTSRILALDSSMLRRGHQLSWTRLATYDHHAVIDEVIGPNSINVFELTKHKLNGVIKHSNNMQIFDGNNSVYIVTNLPPKNPDIVLEEAQNRLGDADYSLLTYNCENLASDDSCWPPQVRKVYNKVVNTVLQWLPKMITTLGTNARPIAYALLEADDLVKGAAHAFAAGVVLHVIGFIAPSIVEGVSMWWDCNHDWKYNMKTRIIAGLLGTGLTLAAAGALAILTSSAGAACGVIAIGVAGTAATKLTMNLYRRYDDKKACRKAFKGLY